MRHSPRIKLEGREHIGGPVYIDGEYCGHLSQYSPGMAAKASELSPRGDKPGWYAIYSRYTGLAEEHGSRGVVMVPQYERKDLGLFNRKADALRAIVSASPHPELAQSVK